MQFGSDALDQIEFWPIGWGQANQLYFFRHLEGGLLVPSAFIDNHHDLLMPMLSCEFVEKDVYEIAVFVVK